VIGSGIYLLPAATVALLGPFSLWGVVAAGIVVALLVLCYAQAASYFDEPGGSYLYAREAFGRFAGFEIGWMIWLTRISSAAALSNALADAVARFWPWAGAGMGRIAVIVVSLGFLTGVNIIGVRSAARTGVVLVIGKMLPLLLFVAIGAFYIDPQLAFSGQRPDPHDLQRMGEAALLLLYAYAGFENIPARPASTAIHAATIPFALITMIITVTVIYGAVQVVAQGTLAGLASSGTPLADAAAGFRRGGPGTDPHPSARPSPSWVPGYGPKILAQVHPRFHTPAASILCQGLIALGLALSGSFVQLALLSMTTRLFAYIGTAAAVLVLARRYADRPGALKLPGGPLIPVLALLLCLALFASASWQNIAAALVAFVIGAVIYTLPRKDADAG
jgi:Amino acid transporters